MNYKVLYRKYRPDNFDSLIGQKPVVTILKNSIKDDKIAHAYLFSGPRGTGKTSTARILAKAINCLNNSDGLACDKCDSCLSFANNPDIIEIDAASNNGVDEIRELINNVKIMPTSLKYKVYIIDEVHMLSQSAFNALLLTLEEPPEHVIFILATTNIESVPITIVSRCQRFDFKRINNEDIFERLKYVCDNEKIAYDEAGLREIALLSDGGLRDALSILDQLSKNDVTITVDLVSKEIGSISNQKINDLITALDSDDITKIDDIFNDFQNANLNYKVVIKKIIYSLSEYGEKLLLGANSKRLTYDECKNIVFELNDLINKININVDAYLLIKMVFLNYVNVNNNVKSLEKNSEILAQEDEKIEKDSKISSKEIENVNKTIAKIDVKTPVNMPKINSDFVNIRVNNCFVNASKKYLADIKHKWEDFLSNLKDKKLKGLLEDTEVVTSSDKYVIIVTHIKHKDSEINEKLNIIETEFNNEFTLEYKIIFIDDEKWNIEKQKYIENLKNNYKYDIIEEIDIKSEAENQDNIDEFASVFDIDKIEIE